MKRIYPTFMRMLPRLPSIYLKLRHYANEYGGHAKEEVSSYIRDIFSELFSAANIELVVDGAENIPSDGGFILYPNHQSLLDVPAVTVGCPRPIAAVMKKELANIPFVKQLAAATGSQCLDREDAKQAIGVIRAVSLEVKAGQGYLIFPEGTRSKAGEGIGAFKAGSFKCATRAKCPIVPVAISGTREALRTSTKETCRISVSFLKPLFQSEYGASNTSQIANVVRGRIESALSGEAHNDQEKE